MPKMRPEKARKILSDFRKNNFVVGKTLKENGYTPLSADKAGGKIIAVATRTLAREIANADLDQIRKDPVMLRNIDIIGLSEEEVSEGLKDIAKQTRDYSTKLKLLAILAKDIGANLDDAVEKKQPLLNVVVENVDTATRNDNVIEVVSTMSENAYCATNEVGGTPEGDIGKSESTT
jgi:CBS domain-containing protein